ncbi:membrane protein [Bacillus manliponensis]|uniref:Anti-sigma-W factor RsiW n=1 Tax=Bacillus manliponensis TaxID=574376 RepID=A0A073JUN7_9BACI|nr:DUF4179 domain-containing protein [Bacillus manliponensis]KEK18000.1 membrane protein [Bacillus manliponensis]
MNCNDIGFIQAYIDGELSSDSKKKFLKHLNTCKDCQSLLTEANELKEWESSIFQDEYTHASKEIHVDVEQAWKTFEDRSKKENVSHIHFKTEKKKGWFTNMNSKSKRLMYTAVAAVGLFATAMIPQVQVAATNLASYFMNEVANDKVVNEGITDENGVTLDMTKNGHFLPLDEKITDQGITVHFKELYVADSRISIHYRIEKEDGSLVPFEFDTAGLDLINDGVVNGSQSEHPESKDGVVSFIQASDNLPFELQVAGEKSERIAIRDKDRPEGVVTFIEDLDKKGSFEQPLTLDVEINKIGKVSGSWQGQIPLHTERP